MTRVLKDPRLKGDKVTGGTVQSELYEVVLAKQRWCTGAEKSQDWYTGREMAFALIGNHGWGNTILILAQCARLWAEIRGPVDFNDKQKEIMHLMSDQLGDLHQLARNIDRASRSK